MTDDTNEDDLRLVQAIQQTNCPDATNVLYVYYTTILRRFLHGRGLSYEDAEDIAQFVMAKLLLTRFHRYTPAKGSVKAYILRCGRNRAIDQHRTLQTRPPVGSLAFDPPAPVQESDAGELLARIDDAMKKLPESQREVLLLEQSGLRTRQISEQLGKTEMTVSMLLHHGRVNLASAMNLTLPPTKRGRPKKQPTA